MSLKKKVRGKIKARVFAYERKHRSKLNKKDYAETISAPKVAIEALLLTDLIGNIEKRDVETMDIPDEFM